MRIGREIEIVQKEPVLYDSGRSGQNMLTILARSQVEYFAPIRDQRVCDKTAMTPPPQSLGTHDGQIRSGAPALK